MISRAVSSPSRRTMLIASCTLARHLSGLPPGKDFSGVDQLLDTELTLFDEALMLLKFGLDTL